MKAYFLYFSILMLVISCNTKKEKADVVDKKPVVAVVNYPLYYFAKTIGGDAVEVHFPKTSGDPAYWKPKAEDIVHFQNADLIITNGAGYAKWLEKVSLPTSKIVTSLRGNEDSILETDDGLVHSHGDEGLHSHKGTATITWLDFKLAIKQAEVVKEAMINLMPDQKDAFDRNFKKLENDLTALDNQMTSLANRLGQTELIASHPVYQYPAKEYGLKLLSMHLEPGDAPSPEQWKTLEKLSKTHEIMIWEGMPLELTQQQIEALGIKSIVFSICGNTPESGDFISAMQQNIDDLEDAFSKSK